MNFKKGIISVLCISVSLFLFLSNDDISAKFEGKEDQYIKMCRRSDLTDAQKNECLEFTKYYKKKQDALQKELNKNQAEIDKIKKDSKTLVDTINSYKEKEKQIKANIAEMEKAATEIDKNINKLKKEIKQKEDDIKKRDDEIKSRMVNMQPMSSTNMYIDVLMGASDFIDFIRRSEGLEQIVSYDKELIKKLNADKIKLEKDKKELDRQKQILSEQLKQRDQDLKYIKDLKSQSENLLREYYKIEADLTEKQRSNQAAIQQIINTMPKIDYTGLNKFPTSEGWIYPLAVDVPHFVSAGTFYYPQSFGGGLHLGLDLAPSNGVGGSIVAPIDGILLYADNPCPTYGGLGSYCGWPFGGGNTVHLIGQVNGTTYAVTFLHMEQRDFPMKGKAGSVVHQGTVIGHIGSSGNSSGAHTHIEIINLGNMDLKTAIDRFNTTFDFAWGTRWNTTSTACLYNGGVAPCRERPETFFY